jgi:hypothetical protein
MICHAIILSHPTPARCRTRASLGTWPPHPSAHHALASREWYWVVPSWRARKSLHLLRTVDHPHHISSCSRHLTPISRPSHAHLCPPDPSRFGVCLICLRMTQLPQLRLDSHGWPTLATGNPLQGPHHLNTESGWTWNVDHVDHLNHVDIYRIEKSWRFFAPILHCQREGLRCLNWLIDCWSVPSFRFTIPKLTLHPPFYSQARTEY